MHVLKKQWTSTGGEEIYNQVMPIKVAFLISCLYDVPVFVNVIISKFFSFKQLNNPKF